MPYLGNSSNAILVVVDIYTSIIFSNFIPRLSVKNDVCRLRCSFYFSYEVDKISKHAATSNRDTPHAATCPSVNENTPPRRHTRVH